MSELRDFPRIRQWKREIERLGFGILVEDDFGKIVFLHVSVLVIKNVTSISNQWYNK